MRCFGGRCDGGWLSLSAAELRAAGFPAAEVLEAGFPRTEVLAAGFSAAELKAAGFSAAELTSLRPRRHRRPLRPSDAVAPPPYAAPSSDRIRFFLVGGSRNFNNYPICGEGGYANNVMQLEIQQRPTHIPCGFDASRYIDTWKYIAFDQMDPSAQTVVRDQGALPGAHTVRCPASTARADKPRRRRGSTVGVHGGELRSLQDLLRHTRRWPERGAALADRIPKSTRVRSRRRAIAQATGGVMLPCQLSAQSLYPWSTSVYSGGAIAGYRFNVPFRSTSIHRTCPCSSGSNTCKGVCLTMRGLTRVCPNRIRSATARLTLLPTC